MRLYELPRETQVRFGGEIVTYHRLDGAYSYCTNSEGEVLHIKAWAPIRLAEDGVHEVYEEENDV